MRFPLLLLLLLLILLDFPGIGQVRLPALVSDGMVLQRNASVNIWGWASPGEQVTVDFTGKRASTTTDNSGRWLITLDTEDAGGPFPMTITGTNTILLKDILIGEVWVCSGQSNMELPMRRVRPLYEAEIAAAENNFIRYFEVPKTFNFNAPQEDLSGGHWQKTTPSSVENFSATAYFFANKLNKKYQVPIGIILTALGGSPVEAWMSEDALQAFPEHLAEGQRFRDTTLIASIRAEDAQRSSAWYSEAAASDLGYKGEVAWKNPDYTPEGWRDMIVPGLWYDSPLESVNGVIWFRHEFTVNGNMAGKKCFLNLGRIVDADSVFINGTFIGTTSYQYPPRWYDVPEGILKSGTNTLAVRIISNAGTGGFVPDKPYVLVHGTDSVDLAGTWQYNIGSRMQPLRGSTFIRWKPLGLYNAMIAPLLNFRMRGVIWYQGESNASRPLEYELLFPAMIEDWRSHWNQGEFPFLFVQLANFMERSDEPGESNWARLREAQRKTLSIPTTAMAVAIDLGEWNDIHPLNKKDVGNRLALAAEKVAYNDDVVYSGPSVESAEISDGKVYLSFSNTGGGLVSRGGPLREFAIAGKDGKYIWAEAVIEGDQVIVWNSAVPHPTHVRYAWADNPDTANLYNEEGLPASPFSIEVNE